MKLGRHKDVSDAAEALFHADDGSTALPDPRGIRKDSVAASVYFDTVLRQHSTAATLPHFPVKSG